MDNEVTFGAEALDQWDKLMTDTGQMVAPDVLSGVDLAVHTLVWLNKRRLQREQERLAIAASEMYPHKRDALIASLIKARQVTNASGGATLEETTSHLQERANVPDQEQIALYWALTGDVLPQNIKESTGQWVPTTAVNIDLEIRRRAAQRGLATPLNAPSALINLIFAVQPTPEEASFMGWEDILSGWNEQRGRRIVYGYEALRSAMLRARASERSDVHKERRMPLWLQRGLWGFVSRFHARSKPPLQIHVAAYWSLTGEPPNEDWNRGQIASKIRKLEKLRHTPVSLSDALERVCDIVQIPKRSGPPLASPNTQPNFWRLPKTVAWGEPDWGTVHAVTPWPNERTPFDAKAAEDDVAPEIRMQAYEPAMRRTIAIGEQFLGADGWYYLYLPTAVSPGHDPVPGRIIMRRGKYFDEFPTWKTTLTSEQVWTALRDRRALPDAIAAEFTQARVGNEVALQDFWSIVGYNPPGYVVGLGHDVPPFQREHGEPEEPNPSARRSITQNRSRAVQREQVL